MNKTDHALTMPSPEREPEAEPRPERLPFDVPGWVPAAVAAEARTIWFRPREKWQPPELYQAAEKSVFAAVIRRP